jgi:hypothetical protein
MYEIRREDVASLEIDETAVFAMRTNPAGPRNVCSGSRHHRPLFLPITSLVARLPTSGERDDRR